MHPLSDDEARDCQPMCVYGVPNGLVHRDVQVPHTDKLNRAFEDPPWKLTLGDA